MPEYWFKTKGKNYILNIEPNKEDTFLKSETDYGYTFERFILQNDEVILATESMREQALISEKVITVKCTSIMGETEVIDSREIKNKINLIRDDLILFVKRNLLYSQKNLWNINPERVENAINKSLYEYNYKNNFPIELIVLDSRKLVIKYFLNDKKDRRFLEDVIVKDEYLFGNQIRVLTLKEDSHLVLKTEKSQNSEMKQIILKPKNMIPKIPLKEQEIKKLDILLKIVKTPVTSKEIMVALELKDRETFYNNYLKPAIKEGFVEYTIPEKPRSPKQRYLITKKGLDFLEKIDDGNKF